MKLWKALKILAKIMSRALPLENIVTERLNVKYDKQNSMGVCNIWANVSNLIHLETLKTSRIVTSAFHF